MKKNVLIFGANSFISKSFILKYILKHNIISVYKSKTKDSLNFDFMNCNEINALADKIKFPIDAILFLQGINPFMGASDITEEHFLKMLKINLVTPALLLQALEKKLADSCAIVFFSSVAKQKGSYDPSYAAAKSGLVGLMHSLANAYTKQRFNIISMGLVENSPVFNQMTDNFRAKHAEHMQNGSFIKAENVANVIDLIISNSNLNRADIPVDGGFS